MALRLEHVLNLFTYFLMQSRTKLKTSYYIIIFLMLLIILATMNQHPPMHHQG